MSESDKEITDDVRLVTPDSPLAFKTYRKKVSVFKSLFNYVIGNCLLNVMIVL